MEGKYTFCPKCGAELEFKIPNEFDDHERLTCSRSDCGFIFYQNSKPTVGATIVNKERDKILLVQRAYEPKTGFWDIAGGFLEYGEDPKEGTKREVREELGVEIKIIDFIGIFMDHYEVTDESTLNIHYVAEIVSGEPQASDDISGYKWFAKDELPKEMAFENNHDALNVFQEKYWS